MSNLPSEKVLAVYWIPSVGIGEGTPPPAVLPGSQTVHVPILDVLNYKRKDGTPQINVVNLCGATFTTPDKFGKKDYLNFDPLLQKVLTDGSIKKIREAGIKVVLCIVGANDVSVGWSSIPKKQIKGFVDYLNTDILSGYGLDGIDIDDEYAITGDTLVETVKTMRSTFPADKAISKALFSDQGVIPQIKDYLTYGGIMYYGNDAAYLEECFNEYVRLGLKNDQLMIGVNAGPVAQPRGNFTSVSTTVALTKWQPSKGTKLGMMVWTFSQDIQQFTANPQNQVDKKFPNPDDHEWQRAIIEQMET